MTTLIIGCGYLGRRVGRLLRERGERVFGMVRSAEHAETLATRWEIEPIVADVLVPSSLDVLPAADHVLYCIGFDRASGASRRAVIIEGLRRVLDRLVGRVDRFVFASTTGVYAQDDGGWVDEDATTEPRHESAQVALEAEELARSFATRSGSPLLLRFAGLYGPGRIIQREPLLRGEPIAGDPDRYLNLVHIDDAARAAESALMAEDIAGILNVADDDPGPRLRYYQIAASLIGAPPPRFRSPEPGSARGEAHRRIANRRLKDRLNFRLAYPTIEVGLPAALAAEDDGGAGS